MSLTPIPSGPPGPAVMIAEYGGRREVLHFCGNEKLTRECRIGHSRRVGAYWSTPLWNFAVRLEGDRLAGVTARALGVCRTNITDGYTEDSLPVRARIGWV